MACSDCGGRGVVQRIRQSILHSFSEPCPVCGGGGLVQSKPSIVNQIERWIQRFKSESGELRLTLTLHPNIAVYLKEGSISRLTKIMFRCRVLVKMVEDPKLPMSEFHFYSHKQDKDITQQYIQ